MKEPIDVFAYSSQILQALPKGILLTTRKENRINTMTIGWGLLGIEWNLPIFITLVRTSRLTHEFLEANPEFTINVPAGSVDRRILGVAGTKSGRDFDKISELGLHPEAGEKITVPGLREFPLTLECKVIYKQAQDPAEIQADLRESFYPESGTDLSRPLNRTYHTAFYGQILAAYIIH